MRRAIEDLKNIKSKVDLLRLSEPAYLDHYIMLSKSALGILLDFTDKPGIESVSNGLIKAKKMKEQPWADLRHSEKAMVVYQIREGIDLGIEELESRVRAENKVDDRS